MKSAQEWLTSEEGFNFRFIDDIEPETKVLRGDYDLVELIGEIQLDAINNSPPPTGYDRRG